MLSGQLASSKKPLFSFTSLKGSSRSVSCSHMRSPLVPAPVPDFLSAAPCQALGEGQEPVLAGSLLLEKGTELRAQGSTVETVGMGTELGERCAFRVRTEDLAGSRKSARSVTPQPWREQHAQKPRGKQRREGAYGSSQDACHPDHGCGRFLRTLAWRLSGVREHSGLP